MPDLGMTATRRLFAILLAAGLSTACGRAGGDAPAVIAIQPELVQPGGLVLLSGRGLDRGDSITVDDRLVERVSWVNAGLAAAVVPSDVSAGAHPLRVRFTDGIETLLSVTVAPPSAPAPPVVAGPAPTATAPPRAAQRDHREGDDGKGRARGGNKGRGQRR